MRKASLDEGERSLPNAPDSEGLGSLLLLFYVTWWKRRSFYTLLFTGNTPEITVSVMKSEPHARARL